MRRESGVSCDSSNCLHCHGHVLQPSAPDASCRRSSLDSLNRAWASENNLTCIHRCSADFSDALHTQRAPTTSDVWLGASHTYWQPHPSWDTQPYPAPATLVSLASFKVPVHQGRRDLLGSIEFSDSGRLLATASVGKQGLRYGDDLAFDDVTMHSQRSQSLITVGDYDGGLYQLDVHTGHYVTDADEHHGHRILALAHARASPGLTASASEDGTVKLWHGASGTAESVATLTLRPHAAACGIDFHPNNAHTLAVAAADACVYLYDLRHSHAPLRTLRGHRRPASYVKFLTANELVSAGVDDSLALWDLQGPCDAPVRRFVGHTNSRSFVGLSVCASQRLLACGSEDGGVYVYRTSWSQPMAIGMLDNEEAMTSSESDSPHMTSSGGSTHSLPATASRGMQPPVAAVPHSVGASSAQCYRGIGREFVSAVAWRPANSVPGASPLLACATSHGAVSLLQLGSVAA